MTEDGTRERKSVRKKEGVMVFVYAQELHN